MKYKLKEEGGQRLFVFKDSKMVVATFGGGGYDHGDIDDLALQAIKAYHKDENNYALLQQQIQDVELSNTPIISTEDFPTSDLNKSFQFDRKAIGLSNMRFEKRQSDYYVVLNFIDSSKEEHPIGMNNQYKISNEHTFGLPMAVKGKWINDTL